MTSIYALTLLDLMDVPSVPDRPLSLSGPFLQVPFPGYTWQLAPQPRESQSGHPEDSCAGETKYVSAIRWPRRRFGTLLEDRGRRTR
jgi:hypothetical protein